MSLRGCAIAEACLRRRALHPATPSGWYPSGRTAIVSTAEAAISMRAPSIDMLLAIVAVVGRGPR
jgi:hypothetical protein